MGNSSPWEPRKIKNNTFLVSEYVSESRKVYWICLPSAVRFDGLVYLTDIGHQGGLFRSCNLFSLFMALHQSRRIPWLTLAVKSRNTLLKNSSSEWAGGSRREVRKHKSKIAFSVSATLSELEYQYKFSQSYRRSDMKTLEWTRMIVNTSLHPWRLRTTKHNSFLMERLRTLQETDSESCHR